MTTKRMPPTRPTKQDESLNKKAMIWVGSIVLLLIVVISVLIIVNG
ncbi:hypothetical protein [Paenibacillus marinisediminis]